MSEHPYAVTLHGYEDIYILIEFSRVLNKLMPMPKYYITGDKRWCGQWVSTGWWHSDYA